MEFLNVYNTSFAFNAFCDMDTDKRNEIRNALFANFMDFTFCNGNLYAQGRTIKLPKGVYNNSQKLYEWTMKQIQKTLARIEENMKKYNN